MEPGRTNPVVWVVWWLENLGCYGHHIPYNSLNASDQGGNMAYQYIVNTFTDEMKDEFYITRKPNDHIDRYGVIVWDGFTFETALACYYCDNQAYQH